MLNALLRNAIFPAFIFASCAAFAAIDWAELSNREWLRNVDYTYDSYSGPVFELKYDELNFESKRKLFGVKLPRTFVFSNLRITAYAKNIGGRELEQLDCDIPFAMEARGFALTVVGERHTLVLRSKEEFKRGALSIVLKGDVTITISGKRKAISDAVLTLEGRTLKLRTDAGSGINLKF